ncbi:hypothetical protein LUZ60_008487 [Juncus effusus]|nr:hypothetical protein LUZ60_008487 [Juncus effusus]
MRPLKNIVYDSYVNASQFTDLIARVDFGGNKITRYPVDIYDRIWYPMTGVETNISTSLKVDNSYNYFVPPSSVLQTAVIPSKSSLNASWSLDFFWTTEDGDPPFYVNCHFAEIQSLPSSGKREFNIFYNEEIWFEHETPKYLKINSLYSTGPLSDPKSGTDEFHFTLNATSNSTVPPLINAMEIFSVLSVNNAMTDLDDVEAISAIKSEYKVNKSWTGDPCSPVNYSWAGIGCSYTGNSPKVISLNLSSSGFTGSLSSSFSKLQNLKILDLSNNKLTGTIPDFLSTMTSLQVLVLSCNSFTGSVPDALQKKSNSGLLTFKNDKICTYKKKSPIVFIVSVVVTVVVVVLLLGLLFLICRQKARCIRPKVPDPMTVPERVIEIHEVQLKTRKYTKQDLEKITNNFTKRIGGGGFGSVFAGILGDGTAVAVKRLSETSTQGLKQFLTEAESLATLHHRNLVSLVGYCEDKSCLALVYEYMARGSLEDHIKGDRDYRRTLGWRDRLHVVLEAAQGLDYLHRGCSVPIVHRDVKSSNILLGSNLEAKVSDLGLARAFSSSAQMGTLPTAICGTRGYIDPEYYGTGILTEKSDVYSFGAVLMEIITGQSSVVRGPTGDVNLVHYVKEKMKRGDITSIIDTRFQGSYDLNSVWKVMELALSCTNETSTPRPTMAGVVAQLISVKEMENYRGGGLRNESVNSDGTSVGYDSSFPNESEGFSDYGPSAR